MPIDPQAAPLNADQTRDLQAAAVEALAVLRDLLRDRATGNHYSRVNAACWKLSTALEQVVADDVPGNGASPGAEG